jgi:transposase
LGQPEVLTAAYAATTRAAVAVLRTLDEQVTVLQGQVDAHFGQHPDAEIILSQPGLGRILGARVLAEFGDDPTATPTPGRARTTPVPARSPAPLAKEGRDRPICAQ